MKNLNFALCITMFLLFANRAFSSEAGMPQLNPEFWTAQIFWLIIIFSILYLAIWQIFSPKITYSIENRKSRVVNDLDEAQKLKESAEKKLKEYDEIILSAKKDAKTIIENNRKKLEEEIENKKKKFNSEIEKELVALEKEIKDLKKSSLPNISKISVETSSEIIKQIIGTDINKSNVTAIVDDILKRNMERNI